MASFSFQLAMHASIPTNSSGFSALRQSALVAKHIQFALSSATHTESSISVARKCTLLYKRHNKVEHYHWSHTDYYQRTLNECMCVFELVCLNSSLSNRSPAQPMTFHIILSLCLFDLIVKAILRSFFQRLPIYMYIRFRMNLNSGWHRR